MLFLADVQIGLAKIRLFLADVQIGLAKISLFLAKLVYS